MPALSQPTSDFTERCRLADGHAARSGLAVWNTLVRVDSWVPHLVLMGKLEEALLIDRRSDGKISEAGYSHRMLLQTILPISLV